MTNTTSTQRFGFPVFLNPEQLHLLIVGGGKNSVELLRNLTVNNNFASIVITAAEFHPDLLIIAEALPFIKIVNREPDETDFVGKHFIFINDFCDHHKKDFQKWATQNNTQIYFDNAPEISNFQPGTRVEKGRLKLAFSVPDASPALSHRVQKTLHAIVPEELDDIIGNLTGIQGDSHRTIREKVAVINQFTKEVVRKKNYYNPYAELENTTKIVKTAQLKANVYLGIIGGLVFIGLFFLVISQFDLYPDIRLFLVQDNHIFLWMFLVGFLAEIVAGSMGMGYGVICTTILLMLNVPPPVVSASIHSAESFTTAAGSISHFKLKNINFKLVKRLAPFAITGAIIGALLLTYLGEHFADYVKPVISLYTLYLGINIFRKTIKKRAVNYKTKRSSLPVLGILGGFIDSFAGGGWGPLVTGSLIKDGRTPRYVVGSSTLTKFLLTVTSAVTFLFTIGIHHWHIVLGLLLGGIVTAPFSAMLTSKLPVKKMTIAISILVVIMSLISIAKATSKML